MLAKIVIDSYGDVYFYNENGDYHRTDGGPALEFASGGEFWYVNNHLHRIDGPAFMSHDGNKSWWINGIEYTEEAFNEYVGSLC